MSYSHNSRLIQALAHGNYTQSIGYGHDFIVRIGLILKLRQIISSLLWDYLARLQKKVKVKSNLHGHDL